MQYHIKIDERFTLSKSRQFNIDKLRKNSFEDIPKKQGIYILHRLSNSSFWKVQNNVFYIGAANKESLRTRIKKHTRRLSGQKSDNGKMYKIGISNKFDLSHIFVSYYAFDSEAPDYYPFLFEAHLLEKYFSKFGKLPEANTARR